MLPILTEGRCCPQGTLRTGGRSRRLFSRELVQTRAVAMTRRQTVESVREVVTCSVRPKNRSRVQAAGDCPSLHPNTRAEHLTTEDSLTLTIGWGTANYIRDSSAVENQALSPKRPLCNSTAIRFKILFQCKGPKLAARNKRRRSVVPIDVPLFRPLGPLSYESGLFGLRSSYQGSLRCAGLLGLSMVFGCWDLKDRL